MAIHQPIEANTARPCELTRAQLLLNGHIARIEAAQSFLRLNKSRLVASIYKAHEARLLKFRLACEHEMDRIMAAPGSAPATLGQFGSNAHGHRITAACEAVDASIANAATVSGYRAGLRIVR